MTAKQEAEDLLHKYRMLFMDEGEDYGEEILVSMLCMKCALITVEKILSRCIDEEEQYRAYKYWEEVKQEIEKL
jgi:hypothetical protein